MPLIYTEFTTLTSELQNKLEEPIFVLRANDENAPGLVAAWARDYIVSKGGWNKMTDEQRAKFAEAMDIAGHMRIWKMHQFKRDRP